MNSRLWEDGQERNIGAAESKLVCEMLLAEMEEKLKKAEIERDFAREILVESTLRQADRYLKEA